MTKVGNGIMQYLPWFVTIVLLIFFTRITSNKLFTVFHEQYRSNQTFDAMSILPTCSLSARFVLSIGCACVIFALPLSTLNLVVFAFSLLKIEKKTVKLILPFINVNWVEVWDLYELIKNVLFGYPFVGWIWYSTMAVKSPTREIFWGWHWSNIS